MKQFERHIQKSVRVFSIGKPSPLVKNLWICLHGYGQLADWFGKRFERWASKDRLFVFPEGPHRFYLQGTAGRVGASWMTKQDRLNDIADQFNYLEELTRDYLKYLPNDVQLHVLGFSQGVATGFRWIGKTNLSIQSLICWAGSFPLDVDYALIASKFRPINMQVAFGNQDAFISVQEAQKLIGQLREQGINLKSHVYAGGHRLQLDLLDELIGEVENKA
jgi:predicted esterase